MESKEVSHKKLSAEDLSAFCLEMALFLKSGIPLSYSASIMSEDMDSKEGKRILDLIHERSEMGDPLFMALKDTGSFPEYMVHMVELGEKTGKLEDVLTELSAYYKREYELRKNIKSAITYPLVMVVMMIVVITVLVMKVLPVYNDVFQQLGGSVPEASVYLIQAGNIFFYAAIVVVFFVFALFVAAFFMERSEQGRKKLNDITGSLFGRGKLSKSIATARFTSAMSMTMSSGLDSDESLDMVEELVENRDTKKKISECKSYLKNGESFADAVDKAGIFSGLNLQMLKVGFKSGNADIVMKELSVRYESAAEEKIDSMISVIEPTLVIILSLVVGSILLTVMLPLIGIMSSIG